MKQEDKPCFYLYIQKRLLEKKELNPNKELSMIEAKMALAYVRIPKLLMPVIMKELQQLKLIEIKKKNRNAHIDILNPNENKKLDRLSKIYHRVGIF